MGMSGLAVSRLLPVLGVAGLAVGGALGFTVLQSTDEDSPAGVALELPQHNLYDCPDGTLIGSAYAGDRVYVTGRDESGGWLEIRDPRNEYLVRWVQADSVDPDALVDVPVHECDQTLGSVPIDETTTTTATATTDPAQVTDPSSVDDQPPVVSGGTRNPAEIFDPAIAGCDTVSALTVQATDNVAVTQVSGAYGAGLTGSPVTFVKGAGSTWSATFGPFSGLPLAYSQDVVISVTARDAAGNTSAPTTITVHVYGECLT